MVRRGLLGGAAVAAMAPALALAQTPSPRNDGLPPEAVYIEAEDVARDADTGLVTARGGEDRVLARFEGRNLRAREIAYNLNSGVATAVGDAGRWSPPNGWNSTRICARASPSISP